MILIKIILVLLILSTLAESYFLKPKRNRSLKEYNIVASKQYALFASAAFCPSSCIHPWTCKVTTGLPLTDVTYIEAEKTKSPAYLGYSPKHKALVLAFRGVKSIQNWIE